MPMDLSEQRKVMVEEQLIRRGISDPRVLKAFMDVPRHEFIPGPLSPGTYADQPIPVGDGQTISQPYMVAVMTEALHLKGDERVLEIGTGSGYQAAILAELCSKVFRTFLRLSTLLHYCSDLLCFITCIRVVCGYG